MAWLAIWDSSRLIHPRKPIHDPQLALGVLMFEARLRSARGVPVVIWQGRSGSAADFRVIHYPTGAVSVEHGVFRFETPKEFLDPGDPLFVHYAWDARGRTDTLIIENRETSARLVTRGGTRPATGLNTLLPAATDRAVGIDFAGIANHFVPAVPLPGLATGAVIDTPNGPVPVEALKTGMQVCTAEHGAQPIRWIGRSEPLARGANAPIEMRAPYFGLSQDLCVARNQRLMISGPDVEYLFGMDHVFARAGDLVTGRQSRLCLARPTQVFHHIMLDDHACLIAGRCRFETVLLGDVLMAEGRSANQLSESDRSAAYPTLDRAAAQSYLALLGGNGRIAA